MPAMPLRSPAAGHARPAASRCSPPALFFATQSDRFLTGENLSLILQQVMVVGIIAIGQTLIILTAGIDLSCGMVMALGGIVMTKFAVDARPAAGRWRSPRGIGVHGAVRPGQRPARHAKCRLPPFIVTLGTMNIAFAITQLYSRLADRDRPAAGDDRARQHLRARRHRRSPTARC